MLLPDDGLPEKARDVNNVFFTLKYSFVISVSLNEKILQHYITRFIHIKTYESSNGTTHEKLICINAVYYFKTLCMLYIAN